MRKELGFCKGCAEVMDEVEMKKFSDKL